MATSAVLTVGGSPIAVLAQLLALRPDRAVAVVSPESAPLWARCVRAYEVMEDLAGRSVTLEDRQVIVEAHDLRGTEVAVQEATKEWPGWDVAYSGGSPAMSAGAFQAWRSAAPAGGRAWYLAENGDVLVDQAGHLLTMDTVLEGRTLPLADMLRLHGHDVRGSSGARWEVLLNGSRRQARDDLRLPDVVAVTDMQSRQSALAKAVAGALACLVAGNAQVYTPPPLTDGSGQALELPVAIMSGLTLRVLVAAGYRKVPGTKKATRAWAPGPLKELLFDALQMATRAGGPHARAAVISTHRGSGLSVPVAVQLLWLDPGPDPTPADIAVPGRSPSTPPRMTAFWWGDLMDGLRGRPGTLGEWLTRI